MHLKYPFALMFVLLSVSGPAILADEAAVNAVIVQFNGAKVGGVDANTKNKDFRPVFEKELARLSAELPGKPELKITSWWSDVLNGAAVEVTRGPTDTAEKLMAAFKTQPYVDTVALDHEVSVKSPVGK